jgi:TIR domain
MTSYDYRQYASLPWRDRFPRTAPDIIGADDWQQTSGDIIDLPVPQRPPLPIPRLFVSHSQKDSGFAEQIASLADDNGFEFWLDILDPALFPTAPGGVPTGRALASIIEMAILNCTHLIALYTNHACVSRWVPYEYGRAKGGLRLAKNATGVPTPRPLSQSVAAWLPTSAPHAVKSPPEYLDLGQRHPTEGAIVTWLQQELAILGLPSTKLGHRPPAGPPPPPPSLPP